MDGVEKVITSAIDDIRKEQANGDKTEQEGDNGVLLVLDQPDFLLAATGSSMRVGATEMGELIMGLRRVCCLISVYFMWWLSLTWGMRSSSILR